MYHEDVVLPAAVDFMAAYLGDGRVRQPGDFDVDVLCNALGELVKSGRVRAWQNDEGEWFYQMQGVPIR